MERSRESEYADLIRQADLPSQVSWPDRLVATINAVPWVGGTIAAWVAQNRQQVILERIKICLLSVVSKLEKIEYDLSRLESDEQFAELAVPVLEMTARTLSKEKRECFANMLAHAAICETTQDRERVYSMAALLDQLDFVHVATLDRLMKMPFAQSVQFFGAVRTISEVNVREFSKSEHYALGVLEELGLINMSDLRKQIDRNIGEVEVRARGISLHRWITEPEKA